MKRFTENSIMINTADQKCTIKDVAKHTGLSVGTVSGVLNESGKFSNTTRKRVWDAAHALNYTPNRQARTLRTGYTSDGAMKTSIIMHISHLGGETPLGSPFESERSMMLSWLAQQRGMYPLSYWYHRRNGFQCPPVLNGLVEGAIVGTPHLEVVEILHKKLPLVLMDVPFSLESADVPMVNVDWQYGIGELMRKLAGFGHHNIGLVYSTYMDNCVSLESSIRHAILETSRLAGLSIPDDCCLCDEITPSTHDQMMERIAKSYLPLIHERRVTAIVCSGRSYAISLYENLIKHGINVPEDVSIVTPHAGIIELPYGISCAAIDWSAMIQTSLDVLGNLIDGTSLACREYRVAPIIELGKTVGICRDC